MNVSRRSFLKGSAVVAAGAAATVGLASCGGSTNTNNANANANANTNTANYTEATVRVGYWAGTCESPLYVAYEKGYFDEFKIKAEMTKITSGSAAFLAEGGNCIFEATPNFLPMIINGLDVKFISGAHTGCLQGVASEASGITSVTDLPGKKVGLFSNSGDPGEVYLKAAMTDEGLDYAETEWIVEGNIGTILQEMTAGNIDAFAYFDPYGEIAAKYFGMKQFYANATDPKYKDHICCFLAANPAVYGDSELANRIAQAVEKACQWIQANPVEAAALIQDKSYVAESKALLTNFGVDTSSVQTSDIHEDLLKSYTFGDPGTKDKFTEDVKLQWEIIQKAGMLPEGKTVDELVSAVTAYAL